MISPTSVAPVSSIVTAIQDFSPTEPDCLPIEVGDILLVYREDDSGWSYGAISQPPSSRVITQGWFPVGFCRVLEKEEASKVLEREMEGQRTGLPSPEPQMTVASVMSTGSMLSVGGDGQYLGTTPLSSFGTSDGGSLLAASVESRFAHLLSASASSTPVATSKSLDAVLTGDSEVAKRPKRIRTPLTVATNLPISQNGACTNSASIETPALPTGLAVDAKTEQDLLAIAKLSGPGLLLTSFHHHLAILTSASTTGQEKHKALQHLLATVRALFKCASTTIVDKEQQIRVKDMKREIIDALRDLGEAGKAVLGFGKRPPTKGVTDRKGNTLSERQLWEQLRVKAERVRQTVEWYAEMVFGDPELDDGQGSTRAPSIPTSPIRTNPMTTAHSAPARTPIRTRGAGSIDAGQSNDAALLAYLEDLHNDVRSSVNLVLRKLTAIKRESVSSKMTNTSGGSGGHRLYTELGDPVRATLHHTGLLLSFASDLRIPDPEQMLSRGDPASAIQASLIQSFTKQREAVYEQLNDLFATAATYVNLPIQAVSGMNVTARSSMDVEDMSSTSSGLMMLSQSVTGVSTTVGGLVEATRSVIPFQIKVPSAVHIHDASPVVHSVSGMTMKSRLVSETPTTALPPSTPFSPVVPLSMSRLSSLKMQQDGGQERASSSPLSASVTTASFPPVRSQSPVSGRRSPSQSKLNVTGKRLKESSSVNSVGVTPHPLRVVTSKSATSAYPSDSNMAHTEPQTAHARKPSVALLETLYQHDQRSRSNTAVSSIMTHVPELQLYSSTCPPLPFNSRYSGYSARAVLQGTIEAHAPVELRLPNSGEDKEDTWRSGEPELATPQLPPSREGLPPRLNVTLPTIMGTSPVANQKILKFFGVESSSAAARTPAEERAFWFIKRNYQPTDITLSMENQLTGGTWDALIEMLTPHDAAVDYLSVFLLTFRCFSTPKQLLDSLSQRFMIFPPVELKDEEMAVWRDRVQTPVRIRVYNVLKTWLESFFFDAVDDVCLEDMRVFVEENIAAFMGANGVRLLELIQKKSTSTGLTTAVSALNKPSLQMSLNKSTESAFPPVSISKQTLSALRSRSPVSVIEVDVLELARQLTLIDSKQFCAVQPYELIGLEWTKKNSRIAVNVRNMSALAVDITTWVAEQIVYEADLKKRAAVLKHFIKVADLNNLNTLMAILAAINSSTIERLWRTWGLVPNRYKIVLSELRKITDHRRNYATYREHLRNVSMPAIPFLGIYLTDLVFTADGNPDYRKPLLVVDKENPPKIINFDKHARTVKVIQDLQRFQQQPHQLQTVPELQDWLKEAFENSKSKGDPAILFEQSQKVEPKNTPGVPMSPVREEFDATASVISTRSVTAG